MHDMRTPPAVTADRVSEHVLRLGPDTTGAALAEWRATVSGTYEVDVPAGREAIFAVEGRYVQLPRLARGASRRRADPFARQCLIARNPVDQLSLVLLTKGRSTSHYDGRAVTLNTGDVVFTDYRRPVTSRATDFATISVLIPCDSAPARLRGGSLHGVKVAAGSPAARLL